jgi:hypothetical protein
VPAELLQRLRRFLDQRIAGRVMGLEGVQRVDHPPPPPMPQNAATPPAPNTVPHWPAGDGGHWGDRIHTVQSIVIHETSGWPSYASANHFESLYGSQDLTFKFITPPPPPANQFPPFWADNRGFGPQYFVEQNGTAFTLTGEQDLTGDPRSTFHAIGMNYFSLGIENADIGDSGIEPEHDARWLALSTDDQDLTGMKAFLVLHPAGAEDAVFVWLARFPQRFVPRVPATPTHPAIPAHWEARPGAGAPFAGSGDIEDGANPATDRRLDRHPEWKNMLFSDRNYRTLALLVRFLLEKNGVPRNFPLLPYLQIDTDVDRTADLFRKLLLSYQQCDTVAARIGTTTANVQANNKAYRDLFNRRMWRRFFGTHPENGLQGETPCFKGVISHAINGGHPCPGPLFDWHRFAREVWDWWWPAFDTDAVAASTTRRPYLKARRTTPLLEYYFDGMTRDPNDYNRLHEPLSLTEKFKLPLATPIYAMANGVVVAARFALSNDPNASGFLLVRHEVFHQTVANRINYDHAPTYVWSLTTFLENAGFNIPAAPPAAPAPTSAANPDWLNRFIVRLRECELGVQLHTAPANAGNNALTRGWAHPPSGAGPRLPTGQEIERDAAAYRTIANDLVLGKPVLFPLESQSAPTPVRVILGDFLGLPNRMPSNNQGVQIEIFSTERIDGPVSVQRAVSASTQSWWTNATAAVRHEEPAAADLPANGMAWHYTMTDFLAWINGVTWTSEWQKYDVGGAAPARPITRIVT